MIYLLDVNALVALALSHHVHHERVARWVQMEASARLATCSITELGFLRVLSQATAYGLSMAQARALLLRIKKAGPRPFQFLADDQDISRLPAWVKSAKQTTDGHLLQLAHARDAELATLDERIPGAYLIP